MSIKALADNAAIMRNAFRYLLKRDPEIDLPPL
jgi:hypothetical protein